MSLSGPHRPDRACCVHCYHHSRGSTRPMQRGIERFGGWHARAARRGFGGGGPGGFGADHGTSKASSPSITCRATSESTRS